MVSNTSQVILMYFTFICHNRNQPPRSHVVIYNHKKSVLIFIKQILPTDTFKKKKILQIGLVEKDWAGIVHGLGKKLEKKTAHKVTLRWIS